MNRFNYLTNLLQAGAVFAALLYVVFEFYSLILADIQLRVVPTGDPFTYQNTWMSVLDQIKSTNLGFGFVRNWYLLQANLFSMFAPILEYNQLSLSKINFIIAFIAILSIYNLFYTISKSIYLSYIAGLFFILQPYHYDPLGSFSLVSMQLDAVYLNMLFIACSMGLSLYISHEWKYTALFGVALGLSIWARSNSPVVISILLLSQISSYLIVYRKNFQVVYAKLALSLLILVIFASFYYISYFDIIYNYYKPLMNRTSTGAFSIDFILYDISLIPGILFLGAGINFEYTRVASIALNAIVLYLLYFFIVGLRNEDSTIVKKLRFVGAFGVLFYILIILVFALKFYSIKDFLFQVYAPAMLGLFFAIASWFGLHAYKIKFDFGLAFFELKKLYIACAGIGVASLIAFAQLNFFSTAMYINNAPTRVSELKNFSLNIESYYPDSSIAFLWYGTYNHAIVNYFRKINKLQAINFQSIGLRFYKNSTWDSLWVPVSAADMDLMDKTLTDVFKNSDVILMGENTSCYNTPDPYPIYQNVDLLFRTFNNYKSQFSIDRYLNESENCRIVVYKRK